MDVARLILTPVRAPWRVLRAFDDIGVLAARARRDEEPFATTRERVDLALAELAGVIGAAREVVGVAGKILERGASLEHSTREAHATMGELLEVARALLVVTAAVDTTGRRIHEGGQDLTAVAALLHVDSRDLIDGGARLTEVSEQLEEHLRVFRAALPRMLEGLDTVEELEAAVETVADTVEPLQGAAERVGRVTQRLSRR